MYRILVAVDGSEQSQRAARYAAQRAQETGCKVHLLHVAKEVMAWEVGPLTSGVTVESLHESEAKAALADCACAFGASTLVEQHIVVGEPARIILEQADKLGASEIVIGSRGRRPVTASVLGSVAYQVLHEAHVPVVVVR